MRSQTTHIVTSLGALLLAASPLAAQPPDGFPISDRLAIGAAVGISENGESGDRSADLSMRVDVPAFLGVRVRVEAGRAGWFSATPAAALSASRTERLVLDRAAVSLMRTLIPPMYGMPVGLYAGGGLGAYRLRQHGTRGRQWTGRGAQVVGGIEYVLPGDRQAISAEAMVYVAARARRDQVRTDLPETVIAATVRLGWTCRF